jgi:ribosome-associated translation inhibitor RaiA
MNITIKHLNARAVAPIVRSLQERVSALTANRRLDSADVVFEHHSEETPAYRVRAHLAVPGPDIVVEERAFTLRAAVQSVVQKIQRTLRTRDERRQARKKARGGALRHPTTAVL